jgi:hypothetical protein
VVQNILDGMPQKEAQRIFKIGSDTIQYTKKEFKRDMLKELEKGYDPVHFVEKAWSIFSADQRNFTGNFRDEIMTVIVMEEGPEFEMTEEQFRDFLDKL